MKLKLLEKRTIILWLVLALLVSCLSLMSTEGVEAQASQEPEWSYYTGEVVWQTLISADGNYIAAHGADYTLRLFSRSSSTPLWSYYNGRQINSIAVSSDASYIVMGDTDGYMRVFSRGSSTPVWNYYIGDWINDVAISSNGSYIVAGADKLYLFYRPTQSLLWSYEAHEWGGLYSVDISSNGSYLAGIDIYTDKLYLFSSSDNSPLWSYQASDFLGSEYILKISSDGNYIVAATDLNYVTVFSRTSSTPLWSYNTGDYVHGVDISSNGYYVVAGGGTSGADGDLYLFTRDSSTPVWSYDTWTAFWSVGISSDGSYITAGRYTKIYLFSNSSSTPLWSYSTSGDGEVSISSDGSYVAVGDHARIYLFSRELVQQPTSLIVSPSSFTVGIGGSQDLSAVLEEEVTYIIGEGVYYTTWEPLTNKTITWNATAGSFSSSSTTTNSSGQASVTYYAPSYETTATITASFAGDSQYSESSDTASATVQFQIILTFRKPDGTPLRNTLIVGSNIGYRPAGTATAVDVGITDSQGKITITESTITSIGGYTLTFPGNTVYFWEISEEYQGSAYISSSGGTTTVSLTEVAGFPWLVVIGLLVVVVVTVVVVKRL